MRGEHDRHAALGVLTDGGPELPAGRHVHAGGGLVQHQEFGLRQERESEPQPLLLAARALGDLPVPQLTDSGPAHALFGVGAGVERSQHVNRGFDGHVGKQPSRLQNRGDQAGAHRLPGRLPEQLHLSRVRSGQSQEHVDGRRLARSVGAEERRYLTAPDPQVQPVHCGELLALGIGEALDDCAQHSGIRRDPSPRCRADLGSGHSSKSSRFSGRWRGNDFPTRHYPLEPEALFPPYPRPIRACELSSRVSACP